MTKRRKTASASPKRKLTEKVVPFPNRSDRWQSYFQKASPAERYELLRQALADSTELDEAVLKNAFATVSQILTRSNRIDDQLALAESLRRRAPELYQQMLPIQHLMVLQDAIFLRKPQALPELIAGWIALRAITPPQAVLLATRLLLAAGYTELALDLASGMAQRPTEPILQDHARVLQAETCLDQVLRQQIAGQRIDWRKVEAKLFRMGLSRPGCLTLKQRLSLSESAAQIAVIEAYENGDESFFDLALISFGRWMIESFGMSLLLSSEFLGAAQQLWDAGHSKADFKAYLSFNQRELQAYLEQAQLEPVSMIMLLWGLPYVYDWLVSADLCPPNLADKLMNQLAKVRTQVLEVNKPGLWSFAFVYDWPAPYCSLPELRAAESSRLRDYRNQTLPLSDNPADSQDFDEFDMPVENALDEAEFEILLAQLLAQDSGAISRLEPLLTSLTPDQMHRLQALLFAQEFGLTEPIQQGPKSSKQPKQGKVKKPGSAPKSEQKTPTKRQVSQGHCLLCDAQLPKQGMVRHLESCPAVSKLRSAKGKQMTAYLLEFRAGPYWIYLLARPDATLADVDQLLRELWLECCGHLSAFTIEGREYEHRSESGAQGMKQRLDKVLPMSQNFSFDYEYDYGSTTDLKGRVVKLCTTAQPRKLQLLARNQDLMLTCSECNAPAVELCTDCSWSGEGLLCEAHRKMHGCDEEMLLPVVNSPRCGVCAYSG